MNPISAENSEPVGSIRSHDFTPALPWVQKGRLELVQVERVGSTASILFYVSAGDSRRILVTGSFGGLALFLREECSVNAEFLRKELPLLLLQIEPSRECKVLDDDYYSEYVRIMKVEEDAAMALRKLCRTPAATLHGDTWELEFNRIAPSGEVQEVRVRGRVSDWVITEYSLKLLSPSGGIVAIVPYGAD